MAKAVGSFFGGIGVVLAGALKLITILNQRKLKMISELPSDLPAAAPAMPAPIVIHVPSSRSSLASSPNIATLRRLGELEELVFNLRLRLAKVDGDRRDVEADLNRTAAALNASEQREEALQAELTELRRTLESGYTRLPLPAARAAKRVVDVREIDAREISDMDTPPQGRARLKR